MQSVENAVKDAIHPSKELRDDVDPEKVKTLRGILRERSQRKESVSLLAKTLDDVFELIERKESDYKKAILSIQRELDKEKREKNEIESKLMIGQLAFEIDKLVANRVLTGVNHFCNTDRDGNFIATVKQLVISTSSNDENEFKKVFKTVEDQRKARANWILLKEEVNWVRTYPRDQDMMDFIKRKRTKDLAHPKLKIGLLENRLVQGDFDSVLVMTQTRHPIRRSRGQSDVLTVDYRPEFKNLIRVYKQLNPSASHSANGTGHM